MTDDKTKEGKTDSSSPEAEKKSQNEAADAAEVVDDLAVLARDSEENGLRELMAVNYIEYASYVIKDRAIPDVYDGLKPVQRRILHSLRCLDDGRFHKVANVIGYTMQFHPHGDASIGSALVVLANKEYFIEKQGNFGNILTGDQASAARYIECRLTALALEVLFNSEITEFADSYDGRNREPVSLPAKIPSLLLLGADGIAVGMATHILPHNFNALTGVVVNTGNFNLAFASRIFDGTHQRLGGGRRRYFPDHQDFVIDHIDLGSQLDFPRTICILVHIHDATGKKIRKDLERPFFKNGDLSVKQFVEVVGQDMGCHAYGNAIGPQQQQRRNFCGK